MLVYQDNLIGLVVPPQLTAVMSGNAQAIQEILPGFSNMHDVEPTFNDDFQFDPEEGTFSFSITVTSPLDVPVTVNSFSLTVTGENGSILGTINLGESLALVPSQNSTIPVEGTLSQEFITWLQDSGIDLSDPDFDPETLEDVDLDRNNITLTNVNLNVGGIQLHIDRLDLEEIFGWFFGKNPCV